MLTIEGMPKKRGADAIGRPATYDPEQHPDQARKLTAEGKTKQDLAEVFGVSANTISTWQNDHLEFLVAIKLGKEDLTDRIEKSLAERAAGFEHKKTFYPPDTTAIKFYLTNRRAKDWVDKSTLIVGEDRATRLAKARERTKKKPDGA